MGVAETLLEAVERIAKSVEVSRRWASREPRGKLEDGWEGGVGGAAATQREPHSAPSAG